MDIFIELLKIVLGLVILYFGAEWLVYSSTRTALKLKVSPLLIGLTVIAFGTSSPELAVSIKANLSGKSGITVGNIIGSNICNICLILGIGAILSPLPIKKLSFLRDNIFLLIISIILFIFISIDGTISMLEGIVFLTLLSYYLYYLYKSESLPDSEIEEIKEAKKDKEIGTLILFLIIIISFVLLIVGSDLLVNGASKLAKIFGVSDSLIGLSLVAFGTSIPELATIIVASLKKHYDLIIGNAVGSCIFNILAVLGISSFVNPIQNIDLKAFNYYIAIGLVIFLIILGLLKAKVSRLVGSSLLTFYIIYIFFIYIF